MKILQVHNTHILPGGEDITVETECLMLRQYGHQVEQWVVDNAIIQDAGPIQKAKIALKSIWSRQAIRQLQRRIQIFHPDIVHVHNTFPLISPSVYAAAHGAGVPVVQTLNNFRLICPASPLYRNGQLCDDCLNKFFPYPGIIHACYRNSRLQTGVSAVTLFLNRLRGTYRDDVDLYIAPSECVRRQFIKGGLPSEKIRVKPHFVTSDFKMGRHEGGFALYVGRLVAHKGVHTMLRAWSRLRVDIPLKIVGDGPLAPLFQKELPRGVEYLGVVPHDNVLKIMQDARLLLFPSQWYEPFGYAMVEAFATGLPVVGSRLGNIPEIVREGVSGWLFTPGDAEDLAETIEAAWRDSTELKKRGALARKQYEEEYTMEWNYPILMDIYQCAKKR